MKILGLSLLGLGSLPIAASIGGPWTAIPDSGATFTRPRVVTHLAADGKFEPFIYNLSIQGRGVCFQKFTIIRDFLYPTCPTTLPQIRLPLTIVNGINTMAQDYDNALRALLGSSHRSRTAFIPDNEFHEPFSPHFATAGDVARQELRIMCLACEGRVEVTTDDMKRIVQSLIGDLRAVGMDMTRIASFDLTRQVHVRLENGEYHRAADEVRRVICSI